MVFPPGFRLVLGDLMQWALRGTVSGDRRRSNYLHRLANPPGDGAYGVTPSVFERSVKQNDSQIRSRVSQIAAAI